MSKDHASRATPTTLSAIVFSILSKITNKKEQKQKKNTNQTTKTKINKYTNKNENNDKNNTYNHPKITNQTHTSQNSGTIKTSRYIHIQTPTVIILKYIISKNKHKSQKPTQKTPTYNTNSYLPNTLKLHIENNINISTNKMIEIITTKSYLQMETQTP
jgi:hypothetical protein